MDRLEPIAIEPLGDAAVFAEFSAVLDLAINEAIQSVARTVRASAPPWIRDVVPSLGGLALHFDPDHAGLPDQPLRAAADLLRDALRRASSAVAAARVVEIPVCYEPDLGLDLEEVADKLRIAPAKVAQRHAAGEHQVLMVGFAPGQPYLGGLDARLAVPRRATPRTRVPSGAVAIANAQTTIYPFEIAGGWSVLGRTPLRIFDPLRDPPSLLMPGDRVRFRPMSREAFESSK